MLTCVFGLSVYVKGYEMTEHGKYRQNTAWYRTHAGRNGPSSCTSSPHCDKRTCINMYELPRKKKIITFVSFEDSSTFTYHALKNPHNIKHLHWEITFPEFSNVFDNESVFIWFRNCISFTPFVTSNHKVYFSSSSI